MSAPWNAEDAWAETAWTVKDLMEKHPQLARLAGKPVQLDLQFVPGTGTAEKFIRALGMFGYQGVEYEDGPTVEVTIANVPFSAEEIWKEEEKLARLALAQGFVPDGWGFAEP